MLAAVVAMVLAPSDYRTRFPLPDATVSNGWGVNIHFTHEAPGEIAQIAAGGFKWVRMDFVWNETEKTRGEVDFAAYDDLMRALDKNHIRALFILHGGCHSHNVDCPRTAQERAEYCEWLEKALLHFRGRGILWEMWNEPNIGFWRPRPNVEEYAALAKDVGETIRRVAPEEWYIGPATSGFGWPFLKTCFDHGLLNYWDAVSIHPYRGSEPETVAVDWARLRQMIDAQAPKGKKIGMMSGEWGYSSCVNGVSEERQGWYVPRQYMVNLASGAPLSIYYDWKNDGDNPNDNESNFGTVHRDRTPKPAYLAARQLAKDLEGYQYRMRLAGPDHAQLYAFTKGDKVRVAAWTDLHLTSQKEITFPRVVPTEKPVVVDLKAPDRVLDYIRGGSAMPPALVGSGGDLLRSTLSSASKIHPKGVDFVVSRSKLDGSDVLSVRGALGSSADRLKALETLARDEPLGSPYQLRCTLEIPIAAVRYEVSQRVAVYPAKPVHVSLIRARGRSYAVLSNPEHRAQTAWLEVKSGHRKQRHSVALSADVADTVVDLGRLDPAPIDFSLRLVNRGLLASLKHVAAIPFEGLSDSHGYSVSPDGDPNVPLELKAAPFVPKNAPMKLSEALSIKYRFGNGWRFFCLRPQGVLAKPLTGKPISLGLWVHGDGFGNLLRMRYKDSKGQTFQPDGFPIDWIGWRYVVFPFDASGGHWGGPNDGVIYWPISIDTLALLDSVSQKSTEGVIAVAGITVTSEVR